MAKVRINVRQQEINEGRPIAICGCPVALAIAHAFPSVYRVTVDGMTAKLFRTKEDRVQWRGVFSDLPQVAVSWITDYDYIASTGEGEIPGPFSFELEIPDDALSALS